MADTSAYSSKDDLLTGDIPLPDYLSPEKFVIDAAKEIDSKIGFRYVTPVDLSVDKNPPVARPVRLLLQRINNFLASGRLLLAINTVGEDDRAHAYGMYLVNEATMSLAAIVSGEIKLDGADTIDDGTQQVTAPLVANKDPESNVEAFYDRIANPNFMYAPFVYPRGDGLVQS